MTGISDLNPDHSGCEQNVRPFVLTAICFVMKSDVHMKLTPQIPNRNRKHWIVFSVQCTN